MLYLLLTLLIAPGDSSQVPPDDETPLVYGRYSFQLIRVPVWVTDRHGRPKTGLEPDDFQLLVDGWHTPFESFRVVADQPMELAFLLDLSGSMEVGDKVRAGIRTIDRLIARLDEADRWSVHAFADRQLVEVTDHTRPERWDAAKPALRGYGKTALYDALASLDKLFDENSHHNRAVVLFTDGNDNQSELGERQMLALLSVVDVPVFVVAIADGFLPLPEGEPALGLTTLRDIASRSGGEVFMVADSPAIDTVWPELEAALRPHYLLTITVERGSGDAHHAIVVRIPRKPRLRVRYRQGYVGSRPDPGGD